MKNLMKNLKAYGLLTMLMVAGLVITFSAFKAKEVKLETHAYYFMGSNSNEINNVASWSESPVSGCGQIGLLPCKIEIPEDQSLDEYLLNTSKELITQSAKTRKN